MSLQNRAPWRHLYGGNASCVEHQKPVTVSAAEYAGGFSERQHGVLDDVIVADRVGLVIGNV